MNMHEGPGDFLIGPASLLNLTFTSLQSYTYEVKRSTMYSFIITCFNINSTHRGWLIIYSFLWLAGQKFQISDLNKVWEESLMRRYSLWLVPCHLYFICILEHGIHPKKIWTFSFVMRHFSIKQCEFLSFFTAFSIGHLMYINDTTSTIWKCPFSGPYNSYIGS